MSPTALRLLAMALLVPVSSLFPGGSNHSPRLIFMVLVGIAFIFSMLIDSKNRRADLVAVVVMSLLLIVAAPVAYDFGSR
jgi:hypothetical protein